MIPLQITAHLQSGVVCDGDLPIDGILAAAWMRREHPDLYWQDTVSVRGQDLIEADLPLERRGIGEHWYYAASFAVWPAGTADGRDHWNKRFDQQEARRIDFEGRRGKVIVEQAKYKASHMPIFYRATLSVSWWVVGDRAALDSLLQTVWSIGKKRSQGWGAVTGWQIEPMTNDWSCSRDDRPTRAIPADEATTGAIGWRGYRAPYWHPDRQGLVLLPDAEALCWGS